MFVLGETGIGAPASTTEFVEACVGGDPIRPCRELGPTIKPRKALDDRNQGFLGGVESVGIVAGQPAADGVDPILMASQQLIEGTLVSRLGRLDQRTVVDIGRDSRTLPVLLNSEVVVQLIVTSSTSSR